MVNVVEAPSSPPSCMTNGSRANADTTRSPNGTHRTSPQSSDKGPKNSAVGRIATYRHVVAIHSQVRHSCLSRDSTTTPSFIGFRNLTVVVLVAMNLRLVIENFLKYGVLICIKCHDYRKQDVVIGAIFFGLVPCQLLCSYFIELAASRHAVRVIGRAKKTDKVLNESKRLWFVIALLHSIISFFGLAVTSYAIYYYVNHPGIGTLCQIQVIIVSLKSYSYALTNRDLRRAMLGSPSTDFEIPELYKSCPYPRNITLGNLAYFLLAPTLVYQPVYPRTPRVRWSFVGKRMFEFVCLAVVIWLLSAQYAAPLLRNATEKIAVLHFGSILERGLKLSTISLVIWLAGFYALFQSLLNGLAEIMRFGDREFYTDWWNSPSFGVYWRSWNRPVYTFMKRHVYMPLVTRGWSSTAAGTVVFAVSAVLHEVLVGVPTHNLIGVAFMAMLFQLPLILLTAPFEKFKSPLGKAIGNSLFWVTFCVLGQPLGTLLYFFAWQAKYGSVSRAQS
ncbi:Putative O-acyltransferase [Aspergillus calidoustus]|uniref:O-acyltransferase n=1 Tax=Aspergillus calidoustus TaxID=454130 RepID=A0A0U5FQD4_ASPCI|nr:Putative O-acyltransferase [Aspergillus calidoustus]